MQPKGYADAATLEAVKAGDMEAALRLFEANRGIIMKQAARYSRIDNAVGFEDLQQEGFFAVVKAAQIYDAERGTWAKILCWTLQRQFRGAVRRNGKTGREKSLDEKIYTDGGETFLDRIPGDQSADGETLKIDFRRSIRAMIRKRLDKDVAEMIEKCDIGGEKMQDYCNRCARSYAAMTQKRRIALRKLANSKEAQQLHMDALEDGARCFYTQPAETVAIIRLMMKNRKELYADKE